MTGEAFFVLLRPDEPVDVRYAAVGPKILRFRVEDADGTESLALAAFHVAALSSPDPTEEVPLTARTPYLGGEDRVETLRGYGRDLVVLNFDDSTTYLQRNAYLLEEVLAYVEAQRADPGDKLTVIGASMGGLVARYALLDLEARSLQHGVHTYLSFDSPHTGANIPLGVQHFIRFFATIPEAYRPAEAVQFLQAIDAPAARQMLRVHHDQAATEAGPDPLFPALQQELDSLGGYPAQCWNISVCNGSGSGIGQPFDPGEQVVDYDYNILVAQLRGDVYALGLSDSLVFDGRFYVLFVGNLSEQVTGRSAFSYDNAPGGARSTFRQLGEIDPGYGDIVALHSDHCFIPTISALGLADYALLHADLGALDDLAAGVPFDEFHFAETNQEHVTISAGNAPFFVRAVLGGYDTDRDGFDDYVEWLTGTDYADRDSSPRPVLKLALYPDLSAADLSWQMLRHVQYRLLGADCLDTGWTEIHTPPILPGGGPVDVVHPVSLPPDAATGFYLLGAQPVDPLP